MTDNHIPYKFRVVLVKRYYICMQYTAL